LLPPKVKFNIWHPRKTGRNYSYLKKLNVMPKVIIWIWKH
jgi:hypothetical protein